MRIPQTILTTDVRERPIPRSDRGIYQSPEDQANEERISQLVVASAWGSRRWIRAEPLRGQYLQRCDRVMIAPQKDNPEPGEKIAAWLKFDPGEGVEITAFAEIKQRPSFNPQIMKTIVLDVGKWSHLSWLAYNDLAPVYWVIELTQELDPQGAPTIVVLDFVHLRKVLASPAFCCHWYRRHDARDPQDLQPCVFVPREFFNTLEELDALDRIEGGADR